ncbi:EF-hand domain-containing protein [Pseudomonas sp. DSP3-2-2]|uniref:EF-hand domain-containing protein n=1 Tax=unclassified Pseudomonas TaxID=196821 RepID=UPI003CF49EBD
MSKLSATQLERVRADFKRLDKNGDGKLTVEEFTTAIADFLTPEDLKQLLAEVDPDKNDEISWEEFLADYENDLDA